MNDSDRQLAHYLAVKGCGILSRIRREPRRIPSRRTSKAHGAAIRKARKATFKWAFLTGGKNPPLRNSFGLP